MTFPTGTVTVDLTAAGARGPKGSQFIGGSGPPTSGLGNNGDFYFDVVGRSLYGPKTAGAWGAGTSLVGATGPTGDVTPAATAAAATAVLAAATVGVYPIGAATNVPRGAVANALTPGAGGANGTNIAATFSGGNYFGNPSILFDIVSGAVTNVRVISPGLYIGSSPTAPTIALPGAVGAALTLSTVFLVGNGAGYWVQSADGNTLDRYANVSGVATRDTTIGSIPTAAFGVNSRLADNTLVDFVQHLATTSSYNSDGTVTCTSNIALRIDALTPELVAARAAGTPVTFVVEVVSGITITANVRQYSLEGSGFGGGTILATNAMTLNSGRLNVTISALQAGTKSIDVFLASSGTAIFRPMGTAVGGSPARAALDPTLITAQSVAADVGNDPSEIAHTETLVATGGSPTLSGGVLTLPTGSQGYVDYALPGTLVDGDTGVAYFKCDVPTSLLTVGIRYGLSGGGGPNASAATPQVEKIGETAYRVIFPVLAGTPGDPFYGIRLSFNFASAPQRVISGFRFFKGGTLPRFMAVPTVVSDAITSSVQYESGAGSLIRRLWVLADSVFRSTTLSYVPAATFMQTYLGPRARLTSLAVPGSGLRAMLAMAGMSGSPPATAPIVTITGNQIPASGSVAVTAWTGDPLTFFYTSNPAVSTVFYLRGVKMRVRITAWTGQFFPSPGSFFLDRVTPGVAVTCPPNTQLIGEQALAMRDDFVMLEGSINPSNPSMTVLQGAATFFAARDALSPANHSLYMPNLIGVSGTTPTTQNTGHPNTAALVSSYGATRILDLNASGIPSGNFLSTDEAALLATAGFSPTSTDNAYMALGWRPPGLAQTDMYHPNDLCSLLIAYRVVFSPAVQNYMENIL